MSGSWHTRPDRRDPFPGAGISSEAISPTLAFEKWHAYGLGERGQLLYEGPEARLEFLRAVAGAVDGVVRGAGHQRYVDWYDRYRQALEELPGTSYLELEAETVWRLVTGLATNPALETGLTLHRLGGFPLVPGASLKGLVHHVAELELLEGREEWVDELLRAEREEEPPPLPAPEAIEALLAGAREVWRLFGSLTVVPKRHPRRQTLRHPVPPRALLEGWLAHGDLDGEVAREVRMLMTEHTGGRVAFYDAVPAPEQAVERALEVDVMTPHHREYYESAGGKPPSDDQEPNPVTFLTVAAGVRFVFPVRVRSEVVADGEGGERGRVQDGEAVLERVRSWLHLALTERGAGAKTAAGYGYFGGWREEGE